MVKRLRKDMEVFPTLVGVCLNKRSFDETAGKWGQEPPFYCLFCLIKAYLISIRQIPIKTTLIQECQSLPHARGGVSMTDTKKPQKVRSSPRSWGCFQRPQRPESAPRVFPTLVGVFLSADGKGSIAHRLPHARGVFPTW